MVEDVIVVIQDRTIRSQVIFSTDFIKREWYWRKEVLFDGPR